MLQGVHIIGYGPSDGNCLPCSGISGRVAPAYPCSSRFEHKFNSQMRIRSLKGAYKGVSFTCRASSSGRNNRNPEFPRQNRHGYSRGRNRKNEDRDGFENLEESDLLSSKNGPLVSLSNNTKFSATAAPGPREKEIVELFRKVQAQLRERSAVKEEKKVEDSQGQGKDNETVDSLLKLLRKHSVEQAKRTSNSGSNKDFTLDQPEKNARHSERKNTASFDSNNGLKVEVEEPAASFSTPASFDSNNSLNLKDEVEEPTASFKRPASNFQRKSPIPRLTYQPIYSEDDDISNSVPHVNSIGKKKKTHVDRVPKPEPVPEPELELESELEHEPVHNADFEFEPEPEPEQELVQLLEEDSSGPDETLNEEDDDDDDDENGDKQQLVEHEDLSALKLPELRALAKSRGLKGFSKMKKGELVALLSGSLV